MRWRNQTILYYGVRLCLIFSSQIHTSKGFSSSSKASGLGFSVAPAIGGECFIFEGLSLGGEVQFKLLFDNLDDPYENDIEDTKQYFTSTLLFIRFYF